MHLLLLHDCDCDVIYGGDLYRVDKKTAPSYYFIILLHLFASMLCVCMCMCIAITLCTLNPFFMFFGRHTLQEICNWRITSAPNSIPSVISPKILAFPVSAAMLIFPVVHHCSIYFLETSSSELGVFENLRAFTARITIILTLKPSAVFVNVCVK